MDAAFLLGSIPSWAIALMDVATKTAAGILPALIITTVSFFWGRALKKRYERKDSEAAVDRRG